MLTEIYMPKNGMDMTEGTIIAWLKQEGDQVEMGEPIMEIETDKITMESEAPASGILLKQLYPAGTTVPVLTTIGYIGEAGEVCPEVGGEASHTEAASNGGADSNEQTSGTASFRKDSAGSDEVAATPYARTLAKERGIDLRTLHGSGGHQEIRGVDVESVAAVRATPTAMAMAKDCGVDLAGLQGSGIGGKIRKDDVLAAVRANEQQTMAPSSRQPLSTMRRTIARRMLSSHQEIPCVTTCVKVDMTKLVELRREINENRDAAERISVNDLILKATALALRKNERFRMSIQEDSYVLQENIDIGFAVGLEDGLLVPVIRDVDRKTVAAVSREAKELARLAKDGGLKPEMCGGACITVSNLGMFGTYCFTPIINQPEASIIGVCSIEDELALRDGAVVVRKTSILCTTYDHRIINGIEASRFQADMKAILEHPTDLLL